MEHGLFEKSTFGNGNKLVYSRVQTFEQVKSVQAHIGIKYVMQGSEHYYFNNKRHTVKDSEFLLVNAGQHISTHVQSKQDVTGVCINIDLAIIADVYRTLSAKIDCLLQDAIIHLKNPIDVYESVYSANQSNLGSLLANIGQSIQHDTQSQSFSPGLYYEISEKLLISQGLIQQKISSIPAGRFSTQKELYSRINLGKTIIDDTFCNPITIEELASSCMLSPFHFSRTFKHVFKVAPYQYIVSKRLQKSRELLLSRKLSLGEIAFITGFSDIHSFSKSFKKAYGLAPSVFRSII